MGKVQAVLGPPSASVYFDLSRNNAVVNRHAQDLPIPLPGARINEV